MPRLVKRFIFMIILIFSKLVNLILQKTENALTLLYMPGHFLYRFYSLTGHKINLCCGQRFLHQQEDL